MDDETLERAVRKRAEEDRNRRVRMENLRRDARAVTQFMSFNLVPYSIPAQTDRLVVPASVLSSLHEERYEFPIFFEIDGGPICGVSEFSASEGMVGVPEHLCRMVQHLKLIRLTPTKLPKCTSLSLQVESSALFNLTNFKAQIEMWLRTFRATLSIDDQFDALGIPFRVTDIHPAPCASLIDTDIDLILEIKPESEAESQLASVIKLGQTLHGPGGESHWRLFLEPHDTTNYRIVAELEPKDASAVIYVSSPPLTKASSIEYHFSSDFDIQGTVDLEICSNDIVDVELLFICVSCDDRVNRITLSCQEAIPTDTAPSPVSSLQGSICSNCCRVIPSESLSLHELHCLRSVFHCSKCKRNMRKSEAASHTHCSICSKGLSESGLLSHMKYWHSKIVCMCGVSVQDRSLLGKHRSLECLKRLIVCRFCGVPNEVGDVSKIDAKDRFEGLNAHEATCGNRTDSCSICGKSIRLKDFKIHMLARHQ